ncbi:MAG TPA: SDR family NAD(P)-dependent oxidoreductase [Bauldia sp.]|nr:SDR family NAD(P)-dependent oxidoreductase [Bauldia sp.]
MTNRYDFSGRAAVVTGGARGIGRAVVERLLAGGAAVAIWDRDKSLAEGAAGELAARGKVTAVNLDVADENAVIAARDETVRRLGKIDILVNNAGINGVNAKVVDYPIDQWDAVIRVNLRSQFICCRAIVPGMIAQNYGRIANVASIAGKEGNPNASAYSVSKAGIIGLTKSLGKELAEYNIAVNAIAPVTADTPMVREQVTKEHLAYMLSKIPRGRMVTVDEISATIAFMVSEECSFTTGFTFDVSGGRATY